MSIFDRVLHIPAEQRPFVPPRALTRVTLPLNARLGLRFAVAALGAVAISLACLALAFVLIRAGGDDTLSKIGLALVFVMAALIPAAVAATAVRDGLSTGPVLTLDTEGFRDTRLGRDRIAWDEVSAASIVGAANGIAAVRLTLSVESAPRYNPFRIGGWSVEWNSRRRDRLIALALLDRRPHDLAHTIIALAERHGAAIEHETTMPSP